MTWPVVRWDQVRTISSIALRQADTEALTTFGIEPLQLMEVAGWQIARFIDAFMEGIRNQRVIVVAGSGNNGGDALVAARFLRQRGAVVSAASSASTPPGRPAGSSPSARSPPGRRCRAPSYGRRPVAVS